MKKCVLSVLLLVSWPLSACGGGGGDSPGGSCSVLKVTNGDNCDNSASPVALIIAETRRGKLSICTGTVIAPTAILTAAHCVLNPSDPLVDVVVGVPAGAGAVSNRSITSVRYDSRYTVLPGGAAVYDQAVIRLAFDAGAVPVPLLGSDRIAPGDTITVFGYGQDEQGRDLFTRVEQGDYDQMLKAGDMIVGALNPARLVFEASFDSTNQSACFGDSGGPAILKRNGVAVIAGVVSYGSVGTCQQGSYAALGNVGNANNLSWIRSQVPEAQIIN
ncbi:MAG: hypothetical protein RIS36_2350 [Pseudomonadota bacterium]